MNMRESRAYVLRCMAAEARHHVGNGSAWLVLESGCMWLERELEIATH